MIYIYGIVLLIFWIKATRISHEKYPLVDEILLISWKNKLLNSYKLYAILYFIMIIISLVISYYQNVITRKDSDISFTNSPLYFQIFVYSFIIYNLCCIIFICIRALRHYKEAQRIGVY